MTAETIAKALGGRKAGSGWTARCPAHDDRTPSLSIRDADDDKVLVRCHAGCDQERVIAALRGRAACGPRTVRAAFRVWRAARLSSASPITTTPGAARPLSPSGSPPQPAQGTPVETYLASRGLHLPPPADAPLPCRPEASLGRHLAGDGGAGDERRGRHAACDPSHLPCPRWRREGAGRSTEDDARPVSRWRGAASPSRATC